MEGQAALTISPVVADEASLAVQHRRIVYALQHLAKLGVEILSDLSIVWFIEVIPVEDAELQKLASNRGLVRFVVGQQVFHLLQESSEHHRLADELTVESEVLFSHVPHVLDVVEGNSVTMWISFEGAEEVAEECQHHLQAVLLYAQLALKRRHVTYLSGVAV